MKKKIIMGCLSRGDADQPYLTRYTLLQFRGWALYLHIFHRSDHDTPHDHPWSFWTLILWRGYREEVPEARAASMVRTGQERGWSAYLSTGWTSRRRLWPGTLHYRPATHAHRVELLDGKPAVTLVLRTPYVREWGFFTPTGWQQWREYFEAMGC